ncbi:MAG TPA: squalene synthase HpnC [Candidatus Polarisedimenticolia bacterium]|nr:squalene synthase HpnC [Candidatus Polarisedimenticolia bacterium]
MASEGTQSSRAASAAAGAGTVTSRSLGEAQEYCARLVRGHYENFPVASRLVPSRLRPAVQAIYAFARSADDFADEAAFEGERLQHLAHWESMLKDCLRGAADHPVFVALREAVRTHDLPPGPFHDLLAAFRLDVMKRRHPDRASLLDYCRLSANPIGRLILHLFGYRERRLLEWSDAVCTALQLTNHWQDVAIDMAKDRIYLPEDARLRHGVGEEDLRKGRPTPGFRALMQEEVQGARALFAAGRPLCDAVRGRLRWELRLTLEGGLRILEKIELVDYDVFRRRPRLGVADALRISRRAMIRAS